MPEPERWTVGRLLAWTTDYLTKHGAGSPRLEAEVLLAHARGSRRIELYTAFEEEPTAEVRERFRGLVKQRGAGTPVAYLVGKREFYSLEFEVTPDVLVPRPETELLVVALTDRVKQRGAAGGVRIADVGTGSGVLAVCAAKHVRGARVVAVDASPAALAIAARNAQRHGVADRVEFLEGDLLAGVDGPFDYIVSNPPYVTTAELAALDPGVRDHEPRLALDGGPEGTTVIERLLPQAAERLAPGGVLLVEVSPMIAPRVEGLVAQTPGLTLRPTLKDLDQRPRVVEAWRPS